MNKKFVTIVILFCVLPFKVLSQDIDDEIVTDTLTLEESDMYDHFLQIDYALRDASEIDVSNLSQGMYVIHCTTISDKIYQQTFIKL